MPELKHESKIPAATVLAGKYRVLREIGRGGMAAVYEAEHLSLGKKVAVKVLAAELSASTIVMERFFREARAAASVKSPYIVDIYDSGRLEDGRPFIAMEMLDGETLYDRMTRIRLIDPQTTVRIIAMCAKGLMKAHAANIVHRDLKPENIFILMGEDGEETVKILDFGLAKFYAPMKPDEKAARLTREGAVFGTPAYMSPEQVKGQGTVDHRADLWALGCMAFECLTGRPVWNIDQGVAMTFASIATASLPVPSKLRPEIPTSFDDWFFHALERDPNKRFQSAKDLADALVRAFGGGPVSNVSGIDFDVSTTVTMAGPPGAMLSGVQPLDPPLGGGVRQYDEDAPTVAQASAPLLLATPRGDPPSVRKPLASATEMPPTASTAGVGKPPSRTMGIVRLVISTLMLGGAGGGAYWAWATVLAPQILTPIVKSTASTAVAPPEGSSSAGSEVQAPPPDEPKWAPAVEEAQALFAGGDAAAAQKKLKDAQETGAPAGLARAFMEQMRVGAAGTGACRMVSFARPRTTLSGSATRPSVASGAKGPIVTWNDDHEQPGHEHVYSVVIDPSGHPVSKPRDLTPEATDAGRSTILPVGDRLALLYWDKIGREAGVRVRWIDETGRIAGASVLVGGGRPGTYWPAIERAPDGFFVAWEDDRDKDGSDLYLRHLDRELSPIGGEMRATDYVGPPSRKPSVRVPAVGIGNNALYVAYRLERDAKTHLIERMRVPLDSPQLQTGLESVRTPAKKDRELGEVQLVNEDKVAADAPSIGCGTEGCFLAWHGEQGGAFAALMDPVQGKVMWRKKFSDKGGHPVVGVSPDGGVGVAYFDKGVVRLAMLTRDGVGTASTVGKVSGEQPRPTLAASQTKGEWLVAWQDTEGTHSEVYVARVACH
jgi:eukaryotic-like serine/threonine-protein kinase